MSVAFSDAAEINNKQARTRGQSRARGLSAGLGDRRSDDLSPHGSRGGGPRGAKAPWPPRRVDRGVHVLLLPSLLETVLVLV